LKVDIVVESVTKDGNAFQTRAPATGKERSPIVLLRVGGTTFYPSTFLTGVRGYYPQIILELKTLVGEF